MWSGPGDLLGLTAHCCPFSTPCSLTALALAGSPAWNSPPSGSHVARLLCSVSAFPQWRVRLLCFQTLNATRTLLWVSNALFSHPIYNRSSLFNRLTVVHGLQMFWWMFNIWFVARGWAHQFWVLTDFHNVNAFTVANFKLPEWWHNCLAKFLKVKQLAFASQCELALAHSIYNPCLFHFSSWFQCLIYCVLHLYIMYVRCLPITI